jgi:hypothetical protein
MVISIAFVSDIVLVRLCMNRYAMCIVYIYISMYIFRIICIYTYSVDMTENVVNTIQKASI